MEYPEYENNPPQDLPAEQPESVSQPYSGTGAGRKESPFADSPYEMPRRSSAPEAPQPGKKRSTGRFWRTALTAVLAVAVLAGACGITAFGVNRRWEGEFDRLGSKLEQLEEQLADAALTDLPENTDVTMFDPVPVVSGTMSPAQIYARNVGAVVLIQSEVTGYSYGQPSVGVSTGSGFVISQDGYVVTNCHVVEGASAISVVTSDGTEHTAKLVGSDSTNDLAVLKVEAEGMQCVTLGSSDELIVGDQVVAIGNPLGELTSTMTVGYVSAKDRDVTTDGVTINMLQTDAAINSGNSGGPLFNTRGEVIGITTAKYSGSSSSGATIEGIGFAIPMDDVLGMIEDLVEHGYVTGAYLGVSVYSVDEETARMYNFPLGSLVDSVVDGSCAQTAGIQPKDIITRVGDYTVESNTDLTRALRKFDAGDTSTVTVWRGGTYVELTITFDERPQSDPNATVPNPSDPGNMPQDGNYEEWYEYFYPFFDNKG